VLKLPKYYDIFEIFCGGFGFVVQIGVFEENIIR